MILLFFLFCIAIGIYNALLSLLHYFDHSPRFNYFLYELIESPVMPTWKK